MESRNGLITFGLFVLLFAFAFVFCLDALSLPNAFYGVLALIGYVIGITASLFNSFMSRRNGEAIATWYAAYSLVVGIVFVWYLTRCGTAFGWW
jgi:uncharacterized membrane protein